MPTVGTGRGVNAVAAISANAPASTPIITSGSSSANAVLQRHRPWIAAQRRGLEFGEHPRHMLERPVLQQPREQQVPHLEQRQVFLVVDLGRPAADGPP